MVDVTIHPTARQDFSYFFPRIKKGKKNKKEIKARKEAVGPTYPHLTVHVLRRAFAVR